MLSVNCFKPDAGLGLFSIIFVKMHSIFESLSHCEKSENQLCAFYENPLVESQHILCWSKKRLNFNILFFENASVI